MNLLSIRALQKSGMEVHFDPEDQGLIKAVGEIVASGEVRSGLYKVELFSKNQFANACEVQSIWHQHFGHINDGFLKRMKTNEVVTGLKAL